MGRGGVAGSKDVRSLTGIRGVAALTVVVYHFAQHWSPNQARTFVGPGYLAVDLFFVLSGFLMTMVYGHWFTGPPSGQRYTRYLWRRFARVYPAYFVVIVFEQILSTLHIEPRSLSLTSFISNLFLAQDTGVAMFDPRLGETLVGVSWSLSTEVVAYLLLPLLLLVVGHQDAPRRQLAIALAGVAMLWGIVTFGKPGFHGPLDNNRAASFIPVIRCIADYLIGMSTWRLTHRVKDKGRPSYLGLILLVILAALWMIPSADLLIVPVIALLIGVVYTPTDWVSRALSTRPIYFLGEASYALYLIHNPSTGLLPLLAGGLSALHIPHEHYLAFVLLLPLDIAIAYLIFAFIEKPSQRYLQRAIIARRQPAATAEPAAP
jgi:peptidoglycan/LPS O-acetylase OafA/YrhL